MVDYKLFMIKIYMYMDIYTHIYVNVHKLRKPWIRKMQ